MEVEQEVTGGDPLARQYHGFLVGQSVAGEQRGDGLPGSRGVGIEEVEGPHGGAQVAQVAVVGEARSDQSLDHRDKERAGSAGWFDEDAAAEVLVGCVADEVEDEVDDPAAGEDFSVVTAGIGGEFSEGHRVLDEG